MTMTMSTGTIIIVVAATMPSPRFIAGPLRASRFHLRRYAATADKTVGRLDSH